MYRLILRPDTSSYTATDGQEVVSVQLEGGAGKYRRDILGASAKVTATWILDREAYRYMRAFYQTMNKGALPFLLELILDDPEPTEYEAHFVPGTMSLQSQSGNAYTITAELEVVPQPADEDYDALLVILASEYGSYSPGQSLFATLQTFVNTNLPDTIG
jgi:hypothetical protein